MPMHLEFIFFDLFSFEL